MPNGSETLSVELERAALRALGGCYDTINVNFFAERLRRPALALSEASSRLGQWHGEHRCLEISRQLLLTSPWGGVVEVLKHEMAHQYVNEVLGGEPTAHGPLFQRVCRERGFDAQASGMPDASSDADRPPILKTIARLLALAESPNQNEAEVAMRTAQRLMLKYNIDGLKDPQEASYCYRHLGKPSGRVNEAERLSAVILAEHFFVEVIWVPVWRVSEGKRGNVIEVCGTRENVELASYVHAFLEHTREQLWREHKRSRGLGSNRDRLQFMAGVMAGFREKLDREKASQGQAGLIWLGDPLARAFLRSRHPYVRKTYYDVPERSEAHRAGRQKGRELVLHRGLRRGPDPNARRKLLPP